MIEMTVERWKKTLAGELDSLGVPLKPALPEGEPVTVAVGGKEVGTVVLNHPAQMIANEFHGDIWKQHHGVRRKEYEKETLFAVYPIEGVKEMPYELRQQGDQYCVAKEDGDVIDGGCHDSKTDAEAHLAALRINIEAEEKEAREPSEEDTTTENLDNTESSELEEAVAEVEALRDKITEMEAEAKKGEPQGDGGADTCTEPIEGKAGARVKKPMRKRLKDAFETLKEVLGWAEYEDENENVGVDALFKGESGFAVKQVNGEPWLYAWATNAYLDRDDEYFSTKGLQKDVERSQEGYFNFWHIPGTDFAEKRVRQVIERLLFEAGPFLDNDMGKAFKGFFENNPGGHPDFAPKGWGCSPEFRYRPEERKTGTFENFEIVRTSVLPVDRAANVWTAAEVKMTATDEQKKALASVLGEDEAERVIADGIQRNKELEEAGVSHKAFDPAKAAKKLRALAKSADGDLAKAMVDMADEWEKPEDDDEEEKTEKKESTEETVIEIDDAMLEKIALTVANSLDVDIKSVKDEVAEPLQALKAELESLREQVGTLRAEKAVAEGEGMTRYQLMRVKSVRNADETVVEEGDELLEKTPRAAGDNMPASARLLASMRG